MRALTARASLRRVRVSSLGRAGRLRLRLRARQSCQNRGEDVLLHDERDEEGASCRALCSCVRTRARGAFTVGSAAVLSSRLDSLSPRCPSLLRSRRTSPLTLLAPPPVRSAVAVCNPLALFPKPPFPPPRRRACPRWACPRTTRRTSRPRRASPASRVSRRQQRSAAAPPPRAMTCPARLAAAAAAAAVAACL